MENNLINDYIASNYSKWLKRAKRLCYLYGVKADIAEDILQDVMLATFSRIGTDAILEMILTSVHDTYSLFEIFISRTMRNRLANSKKHIDIVNRITILGLDLAQLKINENEYTPRYDVFEQQQRIAKIIPQLPINDKAKYILHWKLVNNHNLNIVRGGDYRIIAQHYRIGLNSLKQTIATQSTLFN